MNMLMIEGVVDHSWANMLSGGRLCMFPIIPTVVVVIIATFGGALVVSCLLVICDVLT